MAENGKYDRNMYHYLTGLIKFVVSDSIGLSVFNFMELSACLI
jgi:hypothetical protein